MGKKNKSAKTAVMKFGKNNKVILAALGGAAAGIAIASVLGTPKATELLNTLRNNVNDFGRKVEDSVREPESAALHS